MNDKVYNIYHRIKEIKMRLKKMIMLLFIALQALTSCADKGTKTVVNTAKELNQAISEATSGSEIILANGVWQDVQIKFYGLGKETEPIILRAETPGQVFMEGQSFLHLGGENLIVDGLYFRKGYSPFCGVIRYKINDDSIANNSRVINCVIECFNQPDLTTPNSWIEFYGKNNQLDHCYISGKINDGPTLMVYHNGNEHTNNHHQITNNYFGFRPKSIGPNGETIRFGSVETRLTPGRINVKDNYFEGCNGDVEIISDMTNYNTFQSNIFYQCEGALVLRHGNYTTVDGNIFIGGDTSSFYGGLAVLNTGHWITNNYFYKIGGAGIKAPLAMMNGIRNTPINAYRQLTDAVVAYNTWVDCKSPWQIGVGQNKDSAHLIPKTKLRSEPPIRSTIANNLIYNTQADKAPVINHDVISGIQFNNNVLDNNDSQFTEFGVFNNASVKMKRLNHWLYIPVEANEWLNDVFTGYDFDKIDSDIFGASRKVKNRIGAIVESPPARNLEINKKDYGPDWFTPAVEIAQEN